MSFEEFQKIARLSRECVITEKIDGTNAQVHIMTLAQAEADDVDESYFLATTRDKPDMPLLIMLAGSRNRYIVPANDNAGFAQWVKKNASELWALGEGRHFGEWWGSGIQRGYGLTVGSKRFSLFNVARWHADRDAAKFPGERPACCDVVPVLYRGPFETDAINGALRILEATGSAAAPGFMRPEGIVIWHEAARQLFKKTLNGDGHKGAR